MDALEQLVLSHTIVASPVLCPEIRLHLITDVCPLWRANEAQVAEAGLPDPFWAFCWPGGQALARHLLDHPELVHGKRVLDFGAGGGVEAVAAMLSGAAHALASDLDSRALAALRLNARLNGIDLEVCGDDLIDRDRGWEVLLVGDMFYEAALSRRLLPWLQELARRGARILVGDPHRGFLPGSALRPLADYQAPSDVDVEGRFRRRTTVFELLP